LNTTDGLALRAMLAVFRKNQDIAVPMFTAMLDSLSGRRLRNTVHLLGETGGEEARLPLEALLSSDTLSVRLSAMQALGGIGNPESLSRVIAFASDSSARMRRQVAVTLAGLGDAAAIPVLEEMSADWSLDVRSAALKALETLRPDEEDPPVNGSVD
ncbi:MAG TPA: HEAT repeat domain-containing protein, partial [Candidatus Fermentibacter daniensis]|nr:HEAT repeat domain-containing protein [Candidatus Fermentibacter daniensis]HQM42070.1 HEAT repeat domain-containing protein [Candidatus Fermentibacter daniensis]